MGDGLLAGRQADRGEAGGPTLGPRGEPRRMALLDLSSSWMEGRCCPLAARGYSRDGEKTRPRSSTGCQRPRGPPVAVRVFAGNTADPGSFTEAVEVVRQVRPEPIVMVGDRGMIPLPPSTASRSWTAGVAHRAARPRHQETRRRRRAAATVPFDQRDLAEITSRLPRRAADRLPQPAQAAERTRKRHDLLAATESLIAPVSARVQAAKLTGASRSASPPAGSSTVKIGGTSTSPSPTPAWPSPAAGPDRAEAPLDGFYVLRISIPFQPIRTPPAS